MLAESLFSISSQPSQPARIESSVLPTMLLKLFTCIVSQRFVKRYMNEARLTEWCVFEGVRCFTDAQGFRRRIHNGKGIQESSTATRPSVAAVQRFRIPRPCASRTGLWYSFGFRWKVFQLHQRLRTADITCHKSFPRPITGIQS